MNWVVFTVASAATTALSNIIDRVVLTKWVKDARFAMVITGIVWGLVGVALAINSELSLNQGVLALGVGMLIPLSYFTYYKAVQLEEVSRIVPFFYFCPLFVLLIAFFFLGEVLTSRQYLGAALLVAGAVVVTVRPTSTLRLGKAQWCMLCSALVSAVIIVLSKYALATLSPLALFAWTRVGFGLVIIPLALVAYKQVIVMFTEGGVRASLWIVLSEALMLLSGALLFMGLALGSSTLVNAMGSTQSFFVLILSLLLSRHFPRVLEEEMHGTVLLRKVTGCALMFLGGVLVA